jgi:hypothetical protein
MKNIFYSSKEEIKNRILKNARDFWGIKNTNDFDPLVKLIMEALSTELFNVSNDVRNLENRVLDKLSRILAADTLTSALPAHAIAHARPHEAEETVDIKTQFFHRKKIKDKGESGAEKTLDVFFSPLQPVKVFNAEITLTASGKNIFSIDGQQHKSFLAKTNVGQSLDEHTLYIGIRSTYTLEILKGFSFYFNWRNYSVDNNIYDLLALSKWYLYNEPINVGQNLFTEGPAHKLNSPFNNHDILELLSQDVHSYYANRFITVSDQGSAVQNPQLRRYPKEFEQAFSPAVLGSLKAELVWLKVVMPSAITTVMLDELQVSINAFPVVNKRIHDFKHRLKMMANILPVKLAEHDHFLSIHALTDKMGKVYTEIPHYNDDDNAAGSYAIRYGSAERFDNRNAKEVVDYLFELLRDEKASFSAYGSDFLNSSLKELEQNISVIEQKTKAQLSSIKELLHYIIVKPLNNADIMFLEYWTTNAEIGNGIRAGNALQSFENSKMIPESIFLLSSTRGGRARLNAANRVQAFKYGLTTANRIVTSADIINFCYYELGANVKDIRISKGIMVAQNPKEGFLKTTDILVSPAIPNVLSPEEWTALLELTRSKLVNRSVMNIHYRLMLA